MLKHDKMRKQNTSNKKLIIIFTVQYGPINTS